MRYAPRRAEGRGREGDGAARRRAPGERPFPQPRRFRRRGSTRACSTAARSRASPAAARSTALAPSARRSSPRPRPSSPHAASAADARVDRPGRPVRRRAGQCRPDPHAFGRALVARPAHGRREGERSASISRPTRSTITAISPPPTAPGASPSSRRLPAPADGGRTGGGDGGLVEEVRWRTSAKGRRYMMATLSDASGQFDATIFDDHVAEQVAAFAKAGDLRAARRRARPAAGRGDAARHHPLAADRSRACPSAPASRSRSRSRTRTRSARSRRSSPASAAATANSACARRSRAERRNWCWAATSSSTPSSPPGWSASPGSARCGSRWRRRRGSLWSPDPRISKLSERVSGLAIRRPYGLSRTRTPEPLDVPEAQFSDHGAQHRAGERGAQGDPVEIAHPLLSRALGDAGLPVRRLHVHPARAVRAAHGLAEAIGPAGASARRSGGAARRRQPARGGGRDHDRRRLGVDLHPYAARARDI